MRHGHSLANQQGIIVSHPDNGCSGYGLSDEGRGQVQASLHQDTGLDATTIIVCSDFSRAVETAAIARQWLGAGPAIETDVRLRERYFGDLELGADSGYAAVWEQDAVNADSDYRQTESPNQVMARVTELIIELEQRYSATCLLLISHGDALQILQTAFARRDVREHRQIEHLHTAEIRRMDLS